MIRKLVRGLLVLVGVLVGVIVALSAYSLSQLRPSDREMVAKIGPVELLRLLRVLPREPHQNAAFGRRPIEGRGHVPWIVRSNLDGRIRRLNLALEPGVWLSYDTERAAVAQLWRGELVFQGPVYDTYHGSQPVSRGHAWVREDEAVWFIVAGGDEQVADVAYLGHAEEEAGAHIRIRYRLRPSGGTPEGTSEGTSGSDDIVVTERPEWLRDGERRGLRRVFDVASTAAGVEVALRRTDGETLLSLPVGRSTVDRWFEAPEIALDPPEGDALQYTVPPAQRLMDESDCVSCHNATAKTVGPSWRAIALRYSGEERQATARALATRIIEGGSGAWGPAVMTPHPELALRDAERMAAHILAFSSDEVEAASVHPEGLETTFDYEVEPRLDAAHPSYDLERIRPEGFRPMVGGMTWDAAGDLLLSTWDEDGSVYRVRGLADGAAPEVERIAEGLQEPLGLRSVGDRLFVLQKQELTELVDGDGDGRIDEYRAHNNRWGTTANFHEFAFGLVHRDGHLYAAISVCVLAGGASCPEQDPDRGTVVRFDLDSGEMETVASGLRTPNGLGLGPGGQLFVTDNQGDWLPANKLQPVDPGDFFGWRAPGATTERAVRPAAILLPQDEIGNSPTEPILLEAGPFAGQMLFGDVYQGGIQRAFLERVNGVWQGAVFRFSGGLEGAANRLLVGADGSIYIGEIGNPGNWGDPGKAWYGLERLRPNGRPTFELLEVRARPGGFALTLSDAVADGIAVGPDDLRVRQWFYHPTEQYGGPKIDDRALEVRAARLSADRRRIEIDVAGLRPGHVVYLRLDPRVVSASGVRPWVHEAWYTLNELVRESPGAGR